MKSNTSNTLYLFIGFGLLHLIWWMGAELLQNPMLPSPWVVYKTISNIWGKGSGQGIETHLLMSLSRIAWGIGCSIAIALPMALVMYRSRRTGKILETLIYLSYPIPKIALLPIVMLFSGLGEMTKIIMIVLIILFQLIVSLRDSLQAIPQEYFIIVRSLGAGNWASIRHIIFPAILPDLFSALRIALGTAISILFVTETYGTSRGMGYYIVDAWMRVSYTEMYVGILLLSFIGFSLFLLIDLIEYLVCPWRRN